jgi:hypothetical protein
MNGLKENIAFGIKFYKKITESPQTYILDNLKENDLPIHRHDIHKKTREFGACSAEKLAEIVKKNRGIYEILQEDVKKKVYFDIDKVGRQPELLEKCKQVILEKFESANLQISGSIVETKTSFHIILSNYYFTNENIILKEFSILNKDLGFDESVYSKNRMMKCINQSKPLDFERLQERIEGSTILSKHLILCDFDEDSKRIEAKYFTDISKDPEIKKTINLFEIPQCNNVVPIDFNYHECFPFEKLAIIPNKPRNEKGSLKHDAVWQIMCYAKQTGLGFQTFWEWCKKKDDCINRMKKYKDSWDNCKYNVKEETILTILKRFYPRILNNQATQRYRQNFEISITKIIDKQWLDKNDIGDAKYTILASPMGSNKTGTVCDWLDEIIKNNAGRCIRILWIGPRITLTKNTMARLEKSGIFFHYYKSYDKREKLDGKLDSFNNVMCSIQSLHYIEKSFDYIIIDEIETVLNTFSYDAKTHNQYVFQNWLIFIDLMKKAKKVIMLDAFTTKLTTNLIKNIDGNESCEIIKTTFESKQRLFEETFEFELWMNKILESLRAGKKIYVYTPFKNGEEGVKVITCAIINAMKWQEKKEIISYHGEKTEAKNDLVNCEKIWNNKELKCIITNSCISVGVDFNLKNVFDEIFCFYNTINSPRDFFQSLYRIRNPKSLVMNLYRSPKKIKRGIFVDNIDRPTDKAFIQLEKDLKIEADATEEKDTFMMFCEKSNVKFYLIQDDKFIDKELIHNSMTKLLRKSRMVYKWCDIPLIDSGEKDIIELNINSSCETLQERLLFEKYHLSLKYKNIDVAGEIWDAKKKSLSDQVFKLHSYKNHIIKELLEFNGLWGDNKFTEIPSNVSCNSPIEIIQKHFKFYNAPKTMTTDLVSKMLNTYFGCDVMTLDKNKDGKYKKITYQKTQYLKYKTNQSFLDWYQKISENMIIPSCY